MPILALGKCFCMERKKRLSVDVVPPCTVSTYTLIKVEFMILLYKCCLSESQAQQAGSSKERQMGRPKVLTRLAVS